MVLLGVTRSPELVQVAGETASRAHHDRVGSAVLVHCADQLALAGKRLIADSIDALYLCIPVAVKLLGVSAIALIHMVRAWCTVPVEQRQQLFERCSGITYEW